MTESQSYIRVPRDIVSDKSMNSSDVRVFAVLLDLKDQSNSVIDGQAVLARHTGLSDRTVRECLTRLEQRGFITRLQRGPYTGLITITQLIA